MTKQEMMNSIGEYLQDESALPYIGSDRAVKFIWSLILDGRPEGKCEECGETFPMTRKDQKFCKLACKRAAHNELRKQRDKGKDYEE